MKWLKKICSSCETSNPKYARYCLRCGTKFSPIQQMQTQKLITPIENRPPAKKKMVKKGILLGAVASTIIVLILLIAFVVIPVMSTFTANRYPIFEGAYAEWGYSYTMYYNTMYPYLGLYSVHMSGTMRIEIMDINSTSYTASIHLSGDLPNSYETHTFTIEESVTAVWDMGMYFGMEYVETIYGTKYLAHYVEQNGTETIDYYIGEHNNWPYKIVMTSGSTKIPFIISDTNLDWVKEG